MSHEVKIKRFDVRVDVSNPDLPTIEVVPWDPNDMSGINIPVEQGITMLVFQAVTLHQGEGPEAQFPTYPIEWFMPNSEGNNTPIAQPECFDVHWYNPRQCTVVDNNTALVQNSHPFNVVIAYNNKTYGSDPVIINEPPVQ